MTSRRASLPELSAYRTRKREAFPWHAVNWGAVYIGFGLGAIIIAIVFIGIVGWAA